MVKQRKTPQNRTGKPRSFLLAILCGLGRSILWLARWIFRHARKNPLMASGFFLFLVGFCFVTFNALFYQSVSHHAVFIETRPLNGQVKAETKSTSSLKTTVENNPPSDAPSPPPTVQNPQQPQAVSADVADRLPENLLDAQKKLAALGFYDGPLDGLDGPKTRNAIARFQESANHNINHGTPQKTQDDIASLISGAMPQENTLDSVTTQSLANRQPPLASQESEPETEVKKDAASSRSTTNDGHFKADIADIMRVQAALRAFGDDQVAVTGKEDENTAEALRNFQKMFSLSVTGKINQEVIDKMKDIGLIG